jgi:DNA (cytosine-5)-methyltransferase 1
MGGPPCQGFSIAASNRRKKDDARNFLYKEFLRVVSIISPKIVLIENVKEFAKYYLPDGELLIDDVINTLKRMSYISSYSVIDIKDYGIPQDRRRTFLLAVKDDIADTIDIRQLLEPYKEEPVSLGDAISDLPIVSPYQVKDGEVLEYMSEPKNLFQKELRRNSIGINNHVPMQHTPRTVEKFKYILQHNCKDSLPEVLKSRVRGDVNTISDSKFSQNHRVLDASKISPTITASFYSSFIHPTQPRNLTVREAARIQTFPDTFIFTGKKTTLSKKLLSKKGIVEDLHLDQFNQVGNAVPPKMASHLAAICKQLLESKK